MCGRAQAGEIVSGWREAGGLRALSEMPRGARHLCGVGAEMTPLMLLPFVFGSLLAWWEMGVFNPLVLGFG